MITLSSSILSTKAILLRDLNKTNLHDFYEGLPYRYNSITDLVFQEGQTKRKLLERLQLKDRLFYQVFILSLPEFKLPLLECLKIDEISGGILSTYLHDLDREILEGEGDVHVSSNSMAIWQVLIKHTEFSFVFRASRSRCSRTSSYMRQIGFKERTFDNMRYFFNGSDNSYLFLDVMWELISAIENKNKFYSFQHDKFKVAKIQQARIAARVKSFIN